MKDNEWYSRSVDDSRMRMILTGAEFDPEERAELFAKHAYVFKITKRWPGKELTMFVKLLTVVTLLTSAGVLANSASAADGKPQKFEPTWESLKTHRCPDWFRDAKFGIFPH